MQAVCAGFIYALNAADAMLRAGPYRHAIVIGAETLSRVVDFKDRSTCVLFGDGAGAVVMSASSDPGVLAARMYADGRHDEKVLGLDAKLVEGRIVGDPFIRMDGRQVFKLAVEGLTTSAKEVASLACVRTEHGNTSAASVPLALDHAVRNGMVKSGELVLLQAVGAGMAWGSALVRWA